MDDNALYIRCPTCRTVFRAYDHMLDAQAGKVRCGQCRMVFDGRSNLVEIAFDDPLTEEPQTERDDPARAAFDPYSAVLPEDVHPVRDSDASMLLRDEIDRADELHASSGATGGEDQPNETGSIDDVADDDGDAADRRFGRDDHWDAGSTPAPHIEDAADARAERGNESVIDVKRFAEPSSDESPAPAPALTDDAPPTPYPQIGLDDDPLGIRAIPHGPDTVSGRPALATGPATRSPVDDPYAPITITAPPDPSDATGPNTLAGGTVAGAAFAQGAPGQRALRDEAVVMPEWTGPSQPTGRRARWAYGTLAFLLTIALAVQGMFHYRNVIAADYPVTRSWLQSACTPLGCRIEPLRNRDELLIDSHDLQADPAHQGLLILQTTLRNQARHALAFPHLELQLDDNTGKPIVRRVFTPVEYAGGAADFTTGIPAGSEWNVKLFLDASSVSAGAYHLYHFYP